jgi:Holliday junction resolvase-like predicted endonuclease
MLAWWRRYRSTGSRGERIASRLLKREGLKIIDRNRRIGGVEIDLIAYDPVRQEFVLVEVKTTADDSDGLRRIDRTKRRRVAIATSIIARSTRVRVEAVSISLLDGGKIRRRIL